LYFVFTVYIQSPPPCISGIIITTTIIIEVTTEMIVFILLFTMKDVCSVNIHPPVQKTKPYPDLSLKGKATSTQDQPFE
jgi:hypothetical protein